MGFGYEETIVPVETDAGQISAYTFFAQRKYIQKDLAPFAWYLALVLEGARYHSFPDDYVERIKAVQSVVDQDAGRADENWRLVNEIRNA